MSKLQRVVLGKITCQMTGCGSTVLLKEAESGKAYYTCDNCGSQHFARSPSSDAKLRALLAPAPPTPAPPVPPKKDDPDVQKPRKKLIGTFDYR